MQEPHAHLGMDLQPVDLLFPKAEAWLRHLAHRAGESSFSIQVAYSLAGICSRPAFPFGGSLDWRKQTSEESGGLGWHKPIGAGGKVGLFYGEANC